MNISKNFENKKIKNFEEKEKNISIYKEIKEKVERYGVLAEKNFLVSFFIFLLGIMFPFILIDREWKYTLISITALVTGVFYIVSIIYTVKGWKIAKKN